MENRTGDLLRYIAASPTAFHAVDSAAKLLRKAGFTELQEGESWTLEKGKG